MAVRDIELPNYRLSHELWNSISHGLTGIFGIIAFILMMCKIGGVYTPNGLHIEVGDPFAYVSCAIYGFAIIVCMTISCIYHALAKNNGFLLSSWNIYTILLNYYEESSSLGN